MCHPASQGRFLTHMEHTQRLILGGGCYRIPGAGEIRITQKTPDFLSSVVPEF